MADADIFFKPKTAPKKPFPKKLVLTVIAALAGILLLAAGVWLLYFKSQFTVYQDDQYKFSIKYPKTWKVVPHPQKNVMVVFLRPKDTDLDPVQENFNVTIQPMPNDVSTLDAFSAIIKRQMTGTFGSSIKIVADKGLQWGWHEGHELVFYAPTPDHLVLATAWLLDNTDAVLLTYLGDMNKYGKDRFTVDEMVRSLQLQ